MIVEMDHLQQRAKVKIHSGENFVGCVSPASSVFYVIIVILK